MVSLSSILKLKSSGLSLYTVSINFSSFAAKFSSFDQLAFFFGKYLISIT